jgi:uncharacterized protein (DUF2141 family)
MKKFLTVMLVVFLAGLVDFTSAQNLQKNNKIAGSIKIIIDGFENDNGSARVSLCNSKETYNDTENGFRKSEVKIKDGKAECIFSDLPLGAYTVKVYHDENGNNKLDKTFIGAPKEKYGFSNNARATFGPPSYEEALFKLDKTETTISITVK